MNVRFLIVNLIFKQKSAKNRQTKQNSVVPNSPKWTGGRIKLESHILSSENKFVIQDDIMFFSSSSFGSRHSDFGSKRVRIGQKLAQSRDGITEKKEKDNVVMHLQCIKIRNQNGIENGSSWKSKNHVFIGHKLENYSLKLDL